MYYSVDNGRLTLQYSVQDMIPGGNMKKHSCGVTMDQAIESDNGTWKAVFNVEDSTYHEYSQVVKVQGKHHTLPVKVFIKCKLKTNPILLL